MHLKPRSPGLTTSVLTGDGEPLYFKLPNGTYARISRKAWDRAVKITDLRDCSFCWKKDWKNEIYR